MDPSDRDTERLARVTAGVPSPLADKMRSARAAGERRPVTVLFADVVGSTSLVEDLDPEDWTGIVNDAFEVMSRAIFRYEGTIARLMGDGILAFFGAPVAHEDDPERAIRCGLEMVGDIDETIGARVRRERGLELRIRAGVNTGEVVVGTVGSDLMYEYTAMGDAVNIASRMQAAARPGAVLATAATYRFVAPLVEATDRGELEVKGRSEPIRAYEIGAIKTAPGRVRGLAGVESALVGRDVEIARLAEVFDVVRAGQGRVVSVIGEPGIGKTRLLAEFRVFAQARSASLAWVEGRCLSYGQGLPYHLAIDLVRSLVGTSPFAEGRELAEALEQKARELLGDDWADTYAYIAHLTGLPLAPEMAARITALDFEVTKRYAASIHRLLRARSGRGPVVAVCEDVHWADPSSVALVLLLMPLANELPLLFLVTSRPERTAPGWTLVTSARDIFGAALSELQLAPLTADQSRQLVANLLEIESLPSGVRDLILAKTEGNPLFVEEVIRMLIERGAIVERDGRWVATGEVAEVDIPDTLQGLLLARIDRLPASARRAIRTASVIGRQFPLRVLERLLEPGPQA